MSQKIMHDLFSKHNYATDKLSVHSYIPIYEELFRGRKNTTLNVLEIGIGSGGSLQLWNDYFPNATIYGIDPGYYIDSLDRFSRIRQITDDAYSTTCIQNNFIEKGIRFDIVIDDGPHNKLSQMKTMELYFPLLTDDGIVIIEDVQDHLEPGVWIKDIIQSLPTEYQRYARIVDLRYLNKTPDDLMIVLDKSTLDVDRL
jgi:O-antigen biosynthesis protein